MKKIYINSNIKYLRYIRGLSQKELAQMVYQTHCVVSFWERSNRFPNIENIMRLADIFNVSLDDLVYRDFASEDPEYDENTATIYKRKEVVEDDRK